MAGNKYSKPEEEYIKTFNFKGGGAYGIGKHGLYYISYIYHETKITIFLANIKLWLMWIKRKFS